MLCHSKNFTNNLFYGKLKQSTDLKFSYINFYPAERIINFIPIYVFSFV